MQGGGQGPTASSSGTSFDDLKSAQGRYIFDDEESPGGRFLGQRSALSDLMRFLRIWMHKLVLSGMIDTARSTAHIQDDDEVMSCYFQ
ncbi:MAG: hypothetical protein ACLRZ2_03185 [Veillonella sp.]